MFADQGEPLLELGRPGEPAPVPTARLRLRLRPRPRELGGEVGRAGRRRRRLAAGGDPLDPAGGRGLPAAPQTWGERPPRPAGR